MDKQESFLRHTARSRLINSKTKKIARLVEEPDKIDRLFEICVRHWKEGNAAEDALRYMENEAKGMCKKITDNNFQRPR